MFIKSKTKRWLENIQFQNEKKREERKQCEEYKDDLKEATGASVEEEYHSESLKELQENITLSKSEWK